MLNINWYRIVWLGFVLGVARIGLAGIDELPVGQAPPAIQMEHFPNRLHHFVWKNWETVRIERMAEVLGTKPKNLEAIAQSMGLGPQPEITDMQVRRNHISVMRLV